MKTNPESLTAFPMSTDVQESTTQTSRRMAKKTFTEPEVSSAVDVLESTTFFQATDSAVTN